MKEWILSLQPYKPGKSPEQIKQEYGVDEVIKLASNENVYGCSPKVHHAVMNALAESAIYPDGHATKVREKVAAHLRVNEDQLLFGAGLDEVIQIISRVLLKSGDNIVTADLTFPQYKHHAIIEGAEIKEIPLADGTFDLNGIRNAIDEKTKIVWICNPNNPTGTYVTEDALLNFLKQVPKETYVVVDEAYWEYVVADDYPETIPLLKEFNNLIILRTFSKAYGLAALRIGYAIGNTDLIKKINIARLPFNTSTLAQEAAIAALADQDFIQQCVDQNRASIKQYEKTLTELGVPHYPSQTNFIYVKTEDPQTAFTHFIEKGYIVRPQPGGVRISMGTTEQNEGVLAIIRESFVPTEK